MKYCPECGNDNYNGIHCEKCDYPNHYLIKDERDYELSPYEQVLLDKILEMYK